MGYEFLSQSVNITFQNDAKYVKGKKTRSFRNVKQDATAAGLKKVAEALLPLLDGDVLVDIELVQHQTIDLDTVA
ncbi:hypothetical protein FC62_GL000864 [Amylolactobacillus amylotrophicus DSM 20534]|uniref:Uncharacterized protein n=3 Tax=Amylolactobacillus TaxID=2767876 RepID=A0A1L6XBF4_9LACO|nr:MULTISPECIES: hypothetical protein [Amylolactobacillus]APT18306.1 hypothetical protein LA20533_03035 [Amylolactobacillus amylophilus DSM 20533 = JCM 1125]KRK38092.1 hypothetical protein FC62_GL000864 [Amylolactobacillus amylotrophicus DSM 20534]KRM41977.1 hypothetical protein FD40_GL001147 [Amylolactobacillus amylophilus DSM 20533 = JCM 1125]GED80996.1 hypothetical protein LAM01_14690 [Amylolactobacillus amylophilus]